MGGLWAVFRKSLRDSCVCVIGGCAGTDTGAMRKQPWHHSRKRKRNTFACPFYIKPQQRQQGQEQEQSQEEDEDEADGAGRCRRN